MYGYLRIDRENSIPIIRKYYRQQYCSLCHSLWNNYGWRARFLLSYDVTFMAILLNFKPQIFFDEKKPICYFKKEIKSDKEKWKKLAALTILLVAEKLNDNITDKEHVILSRAIMKIFSKSIKKAREDYKELYVFLRDQFVHMNKTEKNNGNINEMSDEFASIMTESKKILYGESEVDDAIIKYVSKWMYFIDAIDDLDKDYKTGSYNPFLRFAKTREELIKEHFIELEKFAIEQSEFLRPYIKNMNLEKINNITMLNVLKYSISKVTKNILLGKDAFEKSSILIKYIENREGIIFE